MFGARYFGPRFFGARYWGTGPTGSVVTPPFPTPSATKTLADFLPWVMPDVRDCPPLIARDAIRDAAIEFCERTLVHQLDLAPINVVAGTAVYALATSLTYCDVWEAVEVRFDGELIGPFVRQDSRVGADWTQDAGEVIGYTMDRRGLLRLVRAPNKSIAAGLKVRAALKPKEGTLLLDDILSQRRYRRAIVDGAKAILMSMKDKAWTSAARAEEHRDDFYETIAEVSVEVAQGFQRGAALRTTPYYSLG